jgi:DNA invertase Pin-like site-specific DNA recombinase
MEILDQYDRLNINLKLAKGRTTKANKGDKPAGRCPFGYEYAIDKKSVIVNTSEANTVKDIFQMYLSGNSLQYIVDVLNGSKIFTHKGNQWSKESIHVILRNKFYTGIVTHQGREIHGNHTALINNEQFNTVQDMLNESYKRKVV